MKKNIFSFLSLTLITTFLLSIACNSNTTTANGKVENSDSGKFLVHHPDWAKSANIYEVNLRQYSKNGTIKEFEEHLPRLKEMGVDILWFMPIFPIGQVNMKATQNKMVEEIENPAERKKYLGSYYAIKDYMDVNPEFGTLEEFKALVDKIHEMGMYVILDIAVNHTAWDHEWIKTHPEYYTRVEKDSVPWNPQWMKEHPAYFAMIQKLGMTYPIYPNETDWWDAADLNYDSPGLRSEMMKIFKYWVSDVNVDGYRCDVAGMVPTDFWDNVRPALDSIKPVFMLAEAEQPDLHYKAFDATYGWNFHHIMNQIAQGKENVSAIDNYFAKDSTVYPLNAIRMEFITNHDENSWNGTVQERLGDAVKTMAVLYYTIPGMPLIYSGQEAGLNKRLKFFEKDEIDWNLDKELGNFYKTLITLKKKNTALWNGDKGAKLQRINTTNDSTAYAFVRQDKDDKVLVILNLSKENAKFSLNTGEDFKGLKEYFGNGSFETNDFELGPWEYRVYTN